MSMLKRVRVITSRTGSAQTDHRQVHGSARSRGPYLRIQLYDAGYYIVHCNLFGNQYDYSQISTLQTVWQNQYDYSQTRGLKFFSGVCAQKLFTHCSSPCFFALVQYCNADLELESLSGLSCCPRNKNLLVPHSPMTRSQELRRTVVQSPVSHCSWRPA
jgi:hypothetical protein